MKDKRRLVERIEKLAEAPKTGAEGRSLAPGPDGTSLAAILREVDETVLSRRLTFRRAAGSLTVSAANRRLIAIDAAEGPDAAAAQALLGTSLTQPDVALLGRLRDALTSGLKGAGPIHVRTERQADPATDFAAGTTAIALAAAWGVDLAPPDAEETAPATALDAFLSTLAAEARAWLKVTSGSIADSGGDAARLARLRDFADSAHMGELDMTPGETAHRFVAVGRAPGDGELLVFVSDETESALLLLAADAVETARKTWAGLHA